MIDINDITLRIGAKTLFEHASAHISDGQKVGLVGVNGCGKSTLFRVLQGELETETGNVSYPNSYKIAAVAQEFKNLDLPILDYVLAQDKELVALTERLKTASSMELPEIYERLNAIEASSASARAAAILNGLGFKNEDLTRPLQEFSGGWRMRLALAAALFQPSDILLLDEPTNHLDMKARETVSAYLKRKKGFILVSHDRCFLDGCVDHILSINRSNIEVQSGNFSTWFTNFQRQQEFELAQNVKLKKSIDNLQKAAQRTSVWSDRIEASKYGNGPVDRGYIGHKSAKMMKRSKSIEVRQQRAIEEKSGLLKNLETVEDLKIAPLPYFSDTLVTFSDVVPIFDGKDVCQPISFTVKRGERIALDGKNGSGKTSILKLLIGQQIEHRGTVTIGSGMILSYVPQDTSMLNGSLSEFAEANRIDESLFKAILRKMDFSRIQFEKKMEDFSAGQKKKVLIAKSLCEQAHLYVWDEPLNYIDIYSRMQIENLIMKFSPTMIFVEHDLAFRNTIATKTVHIESPTGQSRRGAR